MSWIRCVTMRSQQLRFILHNNVEFIVYSTVSECTIYIEKSRLSMYILCVALAFSITYSSFTTRSLSLFLVANGVNSCKSEQNVQNIHLSAWFFNICDTPTANNHSELSKYMAWCEGFELLAHLSLLAVGNWHIHTYKNTFPCVCVCCTAEHVGMSEFKIDWLLYNLFIRVPYFLQLHRVSD